MRSSWISRLNALVLGLLLMGGGSSLPVVDALFYHLDGKVQIAGNNLSDPAHGGSHAERCTLGAPLPILSGASNQSPSDHLGRLPLKAFSHREPATPVAGIPHSPSLARAPPHLLA